MDHPQPTLKLASQSESGLCQCCGFSHFIHSLVESLPNRYSAL